MLGRATKYCHANSTAAASARARKRFLLPVLFMAWRFTAIGSWRNRIEARRTAEPFNRMATQQPPRREIEALQRPMGLDRFKGIGRTARLIAAGGRHHGGNEITVKTNGAGEQGDGDTAERNCRPK